MAIGVCVHHGCWVGCNFRHLLPGAGDNGTPRPAARRADLFWTPTIDWPSTLLGAVDANGVQHSSVPDFSHSVRDFYEGTFVPASDGIWFVLRDDAGRIHLRYLNLESDRQPRARSPNGS